MFNYELWLVNLVSGAGGLRQVGRALGGDAPGPVTQRRGAGR